MTKNHLYTFFLTLALITSNRLPTAAAAEISPTSDRLLQTTFSPDTVISLQKFPLSELNDLSIWQQIAKPDLLSIDGELYYFENEAEKTEAFKALANTLAGNLQLSDSKHALFEVDGKFYTFDNKTIPAAPYAFSKGSENDYHFVAKTVDLQTAGKTRHYKIEIMPDILDTPQISWKKSAAAGTDTVILFLPNNRAEYLQYKYDSRGRKVNNVPAAINSATIDADFTNARGADFTITWPEDMDEKIINTVLLSQEGVKNISGNFIGNTAAGHNASIVAHVGSPIEQLNGTFVNNVVKAADIDYPASIINNTLSSIKNINGLFVGNTAQTIISNLYSNANSISGNFIGNRVDSSVIWNSEASAIRNISANFSGNYLAEDNANSPYDSIISNRNFISSITGDFIGNRHEGRSIYGGMIGNFGIINRISGNFIGNSTVSKDIVRGGVIGNAGYIVEIDGNFIGNTVIGSKDLRGGILFVENLLEKTATVISGNFLNNHLKSSNEEDDDYLPEGAAIHSHNPLIFKSVGKDYFISGNYTEDPFRGKIYEGISVAQPLMPDQESSITFTVEEKGRWIINDQIYYRQPNDQYDLNNLNSFSVRGDGSGQVLINNEIVNATIVEINKATLKFDQFTQEDGTRGRGAFVRSRRWNDDEDDNRITLPRLTMTNATFHLANGYRDKIELDKYTAKGNSFLHLDVNIRELTADMLTIHGNVEGTAKLILYPDSADDIRGKSIVFAVSDNDKTGSGSSFEVFRVYKSPYLFEISHRQTGTDQNEWALTMNNTLNPDRNAIPEKNQGFKIPDLLDPVIAPESNPVTPPENPKIAPEVVAYNGLSAAALEQTRSMVGNIRDKVAAGKFLPDPCRQVIDEGFAGSALHGVWASPVYHYADIKFPVNMKADIWGLEAGFDLQTDLNRKIGIFASYRQGRYDLDGTGRHYPSTTGSEIDIDSYLAGLYYRHDYRHLWTFAALYGGIQRADIKTDDGIKTDTDGNQIGAALESGYLFNLSDSLKLEPSLGIFYTQADFDDATDNAGKTAAFDIARQTELEFAFKLEKYLDFDRGMAKIYIKPSVIQVISADNAAYVTGLGKLSANNDSVLGRIEIGSRYTVAEQLSTYGWANYTYGSDYEAISLGLGLNYAW